MMKEGRKRRTFSASDLKKVFLKSDVNVEFIEFGIKIGVSGVPAGKNICTSVARKPFFHAGFSLKDNFLLQLMELDI